MPLDLAGSVVTTLLMPYLKMGADKMAETLSGEAGKAASDYTVELAKKAWGYVKSAFTSEEEKSALEMFEKRPQAAGPVVKEVLEEKLKRDPKLKAELQKLLDDEGPGGSTGAQIIGNYAHLLDMRNANVSGSGNVFAGAIYGEHPTIPGKARKRPGDASDSEESD